MTNEPQRHYNPGMGLSDAPRTPAVYFGAGCAAALLAAALDRAGARRAVVVTTASVAANPALAGAVEKSLGARLAGRLPAISQHAPVREVAALVAAARDLGADAFVSIGGGSPIDAAKAAAWSLASGIDLAAPGALEAARAVRLAGKRVLPHFAVPTTLSVAERSGSAGFSSEGAHDKIGVAAPELIPAAVFYDAALALHTPLPLWLSTGMRAIDHAVETLFAPGRHDHADASALQSLRRLPAALRAAKEDPTAAGARSVAQEAAWLSYELPAAAAGLSHRLGKAIGAPHRIPHGVTSCLVLPHALRFYSSRNPAALAQVAEALGASDAAGALAELIAALGLPQRSSAFGLTAADLQIAAAKVSRPEWPEAELLSILLAGH